MGTRVMPVEPSGLRTDWAGNPVCAMSLLFLTMLGAIGAKAGGAGLLKPTVRVTFWGALGMAVTAGGGAMLGTGG